MEAYFSFSGYVLIPILNSDVAAFEQVEQSMDMVLSCTLDKSLQLSLFVSPSLVLLAWGAGYGEDGLSFDAVGVTALFMSVYLVNALSVSGNFNWSVNSTHPTVALHIAPILIGRDTDNDTNARLHGVMLIALYAVFSVATYFCPMPPEFLEQY